MRRTSEVSRRRHWLCATEFLQKKKNTMKAGQPQTKSCRKTQLAHPVLTVPEPESTIKFKTAHTLNVGHKAMMPRFLLSNSRKKHMTTLAGLPPAVGPAFLVSLSFALLACVVTCPPASLLIRRLLRLELIKSAREIRLMAVIGGEQAARREEEDQPKKEPNSLAHCV